MEIDKMSSSLAPTPWPTSDSTRMSDEEFIAEPDFQALAYRMEQITVTAGTITLLASFSVLLTVFMFPSMWRNKVYMQMIVMISICEIFTAVAVLMGFPVAEQCSIQGFMLLFFYRAAWMWNVLMIYQVCACLLSSA